MLTLCLAVFFVLFFFGGAKIVLCDKLISVKEKSMAQRLHSNLKCCLTLFFSFPLLPLPLVVCKQENKVDPEMEPFNLKNTLEESLEVVTSAAETKQLELICDFRSACTVVVGDARRVRQVQTKRRRKVHLAP